MEEHHEQCKPQTCHTLTQAVQAHLAQIALWLLQAKLWWGWGLCPERQAGLLVLGQQDYIARACLRVSYKENRRPFFVWTDHVRLRCA